MAPEVSPVKILESPRMPARQNPLRVLVLVDLSASRQDAARRAAVIAVELGATLCLLHVLPSQRRGKVVDLDLAVADQKLSALAERLALHYGATVASRAVRGDTAREVVEQGRDACLLVLPSRGRNTLREMIFGNPMERLIRLVRVPVLVVKGAAIHPSYSSVLAPVHLTAPAMQAVSVAARIAPCAALHVLHVVSTRHDAIAEIAQVPRHALQSSRDKAADIARARIARLAEAAGIERPVTPLAGFGEGAAVTLHKAAAIGADLLVVAKDRRKMLARFLLGRFTQQVLAATDADVLVVPVPADEGQAAVPTRPLPGRTRPERAGLAGR